MTTPAEKFTKDLDAYTEMADRLEPAHAGKWAVFYNGELLGICETYQDAGEYIDQSRFPGPFYRRQIGPLLRPFWHPAWGAIPDGQSRAPGIWHPAWGSRS